MTAEQANIKLPFLSFDLQDALKLAAILGFVGLIFLDAISKIANAWNSEEYSHGMLIPLITCFLIWQRKNEIAKLPFLGSWLGILVLLGGLIGYLLGELSALYIIIQYSLLVTLLGVALAITGRQVFAVIAVPISLLFFTIPLPNFIYKGLSATLQLWSSALGVSLIRLCDISVYQEGNVIDLGSMQLQVVEACSGLRYLFPLMTLAFMCAYFYQVALWKRIVVFLSSIPITIFMNSFRIGVIGITVEYFGKEAAEGFLHDFEGWIVFMACTGILIAEMWLLARLGKDPRPFQDVFGLTFPAPFPEGAQFSPRIWPKQYWAVGGLLLTALALSQNLEHRDEIIPQRADFSTFPLKLAQWSGRREELEQKYVDFLKFDDYFLADYIPASGAGDRSPVNLYAAYYASQRKGESIHSPKSCIPGGGWQITSHEVVQVESTSLYGNPLLVNRLLIAKGEDRQLVYYWFQQRSRSLTNEYVIKWYLFWDALTKNRSDGALIRLTTLAPKGENLANSDLRLQDFLRVSLPELDKYIPQ